MRCATIEAADADSSAHGGQCSEPNTNGGTLQQLFRREKEHRCFNLSKRNHWIETSIGTVPARMEMVVRNAGSLMTDFFVVDILLERFSVLEGIY